jgi:hypothetical protein
MKNSIGMIARVPAKIPTEYLLHTIPERYRYTNLLRHSITTNLSTFSRQLAHSLKPQPGFTPPQKDFPVLISVRLQDHRRLEELGQILDPTGTRTPTPRSSSP